MTGSTAYLCYNYLITSTKEGDTVTVYADVSFFINFAFDAEILLLLCKVYSKKVPIIKLLLASFIGGLLGVFAFIPYAEIVTRPPARFIIPIFMICIVFMPLGQKAFFSRYLSYLAISFVMSGMISFLGLNAICGLLIPIPVYLLVCVLRKNINKKKSVVTLEFKNKKLTTDGFFDTGNMLLSGGLPVILGSERIFKELLECEISKENIVSLAKRFEMRIIPFMSLGNAGTVMGVKLDRIWVDGKEYENVVMAYSGNKFTDDLILNSIMT